MKRNPMNSKNGPRANRNGLDAIHGAFLTSYALISTPVSLSRIASRRLDCRKIRSAWRKFYLARQCLRIISKLKRNKTRRGMMS